MRYPHEMTPIQRIQRLEVRLEQLLRQVEHSRRQLERLRAIRSTPAERPDSWTLPLWLALGCLLAALGLAVLGLPW